MKSLSANLKAHDLPAIDKQNSASVLFFFLYFAPTLKEKQTVVNTGNIYLMSTESVLKSYFSNGSFKKREKKTEEKK